MEYLESYGVTEEQKIVKFVMYKLPFVGIMTMSSIDTKVSCMGVQQVIKELNLGGDMLGGFHLDSGLNFSSNSAIMVDWTIPIQFTLKHCDFVSQT